MFFRFLVFLIFPYFYMCTNVFFIYYVRILYSLTYAENTLFLGTEIIDLFLKKL